MTTGKIMPALESASSQNSYGSDGLLCSHIRSVLREHRTTTLDGQPFDLRDHIDAAHAQALYNVVINERPHTSIEIGMACGISTMAILQANHDLQSGGRLISIDPAQTSYYRGCGLRAVRDACWSDYHELVEEKSYVALPRLLANGTSVDFAYIDGWHTFDYVLLDFFYLDKMCPVGGVIAFNDCGWRSVNRVVQFVKSHRAYDEMDVGLPKRYKGRNIVSNVVRRFERRSSSDRYFRKVRDWEPNWDYYAHF